MKRVAFDKAIPRSLLRFGADFTTHWLFRRLGTVDSLRRRSAKRVVQWSHFYFYRVDGSRSFLQIQCSERESSVERRTTLFPVTAKAKLVFRLQVSSCIAVRKYWNKAPTRRIITSIKVLWLTLIVRFITLPQKVDLTSMTDHSETVHDGRWRPSRRPEADTHTPLRGRRELLRGSLTSLLGKMRTHREAAEQWWGWIKVICTASLNTCPTTTASVVPFPHPLSKPSAGCYFWAPAWKAVKKESQANSSFFSGSCFSQQATALLWSRPLSSLDMLLSRMPWFG